MWRSYTSVVSRKSDWVGFCCFGGGRWWPMGIDRFAHRSVPGKYSHGSASRIVHLGIVDGPLASSSTSGPVDCLGLLLHATQPRYTLIVNRYLAGKEKSLDD